MRWVVRDSLGSPIFLGFCKLVPQWPIKVLEAQAIVEGFKRLSSPLPPSIVVVSNTRKVVQQLLDFTDVKNAVEEIGVLVRHLGNISFSFCPHLRNRAAHCVVRFATSFANCFYHFVTSNSKVCLEILDV